MIWEVINWGGSINGLLLRITYCFSIRAMAKCVADNLTVALYFLPDFGCNLSLRLISVSLKLGISIEIGSSK